MDLGRQTTSVHGDTFQTVAGKSGVNSRMPCVEANLSQRQIMNSRSSPADQTGDWGRFPRRTYLSVCSQPPYLLGSVPAICAFLAYRCLGSWVSPEVRLRMSRNHIPIFLERRVAVIIFLRIWHRTARPETAPHWGFLRGVWITKVKLGSFLLSFSCPDIMSDGLRHECSHSARTLHHSRHCISHGQTAGTILTVSPQSVTSAKSRHNRTKALGTPLNSR